MARLGNFVSSTVDDAYSDLLNVLHNVLDNVIGYQVITISDGEPWFVTPEVKILLRKHNKLLPLVVWMYLKL